MSPDAVIDIDRTVALTDDHGNEIAEIDVVCEVPVVRGRHRDDDTARPWLGGVWVRTSAPPAGSTSKAPLWLLPLLAKWFEANREAIENEALTRYREGGRQSCRDPDRSDER